MQRKNEYTDLSARTRSLLARSEDYDVDYKRSVTGMDPEDLVAFANSPAGGAILIGVDEIEDANGSQRGQVVGCTIGDKAKLSILNRAESCIPPVRVDVIFENTADLPVIRIEIPSGREKPYCSSKGTYKIRGDGMNKPLGPRRLLEIFIESEGRRFFDRFQNATEELEKKLVMLEKNASELNQSLANTFDVARNTETLADEAMNQSDVTTDIVLGLVRQVTGVDRKLDIVCSQLHALMTHLKNDTKEAPEPPVGNGKEQASV